MKARLSFACALLIGFALTSNSYADFSDSSSDAGDLETNVFTSDIVVAGVNQIITDIEVTVNIHHTWIGDLTATVSNGTSTVVLIPAASDESSNLGLDPNDDNNLSVATYVLSDAGTLTIDQAGDPLGNNDEVAPGIYAAEDSFAALFAGQNTDGTWTLSITDGGQGDPGRIEGWGISFTSNAVPEPSTMSLLGLLGLTAISRRRRR